MGKKAKEHRKKVAKRNARIGLEQKKVQKLYTKMLEEKLKQYQESLLNKEQLENDLSINLGNEELGFSIVEPNEIETPE